MTIGGATGGTSSSFSSFEAASMGGWVFGDVSSMAGIGGPTGISVMAGASNCIGCGVGIGDLKLACNSSIGVESISPVFMYSANVGPIKAILALNVGLKTPTKSRSKVWVLPHEENTRRCFSRISGADFIPSNIAETPKIIVI